MATSLFDKPLIKFYFHYLSMAAQKILQDYAKTIKIVYELTMERQNLVSSAKSWVFGPSRCNF